MGRGVIPASPTLLARVRRPFTVVVLSVSEFRVIMAESKSYNSDDDQQPPSKSRKLTGTAKYKTKFNTWKKNSPLLLPYLETRTGEHHKERG